MNLLAQILVSRHVDGLRYLQAPVPAPGDEPRVISIGQSGKLGPCVWTHCRIFGSSKTCHLSFPWSRLETASAPLAGRPFGVCAPRERNADKEEKLSDLFPIQFPRIKSQPITCRRVVGAEQPSVLRCIREAETRKSKCGNAADNQNGKSALSLARTPDSLSKTEGRPNF